MLWNSSSLIVILGITYSASSLANEEATEEEFPTPQACVELQNKTAEEIRQMPFSEVQLLKSQCLAGDFMNQRKRSWKRLTEQDPVDAQGCLDRLKAIDISVLTSDPNSLLEGVYATLSDQISNFSCDSVVTEINDTVSDSLENVGIELPAGLGSIGVSQGSSFGDGDDLIGVDVEMSNEEIQESINRSIWGDEVPSTTPWQKNYEQDRVDELLGESNKKIMRNPHQDKFNPNKTRLNLENLTFGNKKNNDDSSGGGNE